MPSEMEVLVIDVGYFSKKAFKETFHGYQTNLQTKLLIDSLNFSIISFCF